jgi:hypothetical protein
MMGRIRLFDVLLAMSAFIIAYALRFYVGLIPVTKGVPPLRQYVNVLPFVVGAVLISFQLLGLYRLRRGRSRLHDFLAICVGSILAVVLGIGATLYTETYLASHAARIVGAFEVSQLVWGIFSC